MRKIISLIVLLLFFCSVKAQELNCKVTVNVDRLPNSNRTIFRNLQIALSDFINNTQWSNKSYVRGEKIECSMFINVAEFNSDAFVASIQVQSSRPIYNSNYSTTIFNFNDTNFGFRYQEFEKLFFNTNSFDSNLVSVIAFYVHIILGLDADTFALEGGTEYFRTAQTIANLAQQGGYKGWSQSDNTNQNRFFLINDMLSNVFSPLRESMYEYHLNGLDLMSDEPKIAKENIKNSLILLSGIHKVRPNAFLTRVFFDAKADEVVSIFSGGPKIKTTDLVDNLTRISPMNSNKWNRIK